MFSPLQPGLLTDIHQALRRHLGAILSHINGGVKILSELQSKDIDAQRPNRTVKSSTSSFVPMSTLNMLFTRLDIQATENVSTRPLGLLQRLDLQRLGNTSELPKVFVASRCRNPTIRRQAIC
jgi:hypothetical protein